MGLRADAGDPVRLDGPAGSGQGFPPPDFLDHLPNGRRVLAFLAEIKGDVSGVSEKVQRQIQEKLQADRFRSAGQAALGL